MKQILLTLATISLAATPLSADEPVLRAGAAAVDITPTDFPVIVNGGFLENKANKAFEEDP